MSDLNFSLPALQPDQAVLLLEADQAVDLILGGKVPDFMIAEATLWALKSKNQHWPPPHKRNLCSNVQKGGRVAELPGALVEAQ